MREIYTTGKKLLFTQNLGVEEEDCFPLQTFLLKFCPIGNAPCFPCWPLSFPFRPWSFQTGGRCILALNLYQLTEGIVGYQQIHTRAISFEFSPGNSRRKTTIFLLAWLQGNDTIDVSLMIIP